MKRGYVFELNPESSLTQGEVKEMLEKTKAIRDGHYQLTCGGHTSSFLCFSRIAQWPFVLTRIKNDIIQWIENRRLKKIKVILTPSNRSLVLGFDVACALNGKMDTRIVEAQTNEEGQITTKLRADQRLLSGEEVVIVTSVTTTGESVNQLISIVKEHKVRLSAICIFATIDDRAIQNITNFLKGELPSSKIPIYVILSFKGREWVIYPNSECPMCKERKPLVYAKEVR